MRLVLKEDQDAVRLWPLLQGTVYELLLEVFYTTDKSFNNQILKVLYSKCLFHIIT